MPTDVQEAQIVRIIEGDTFEVLIDGVSNRVRIYRADTPETQNEHHCGGEEATAFVQQALASNDTPGTVYLEKDTTARDKYGHELAYVWFTVAGQPYLLNHVLINSGWADDVDDGDHKYDTQLKQAAAFAKSHDLGVYALCGDFGLPATTVQPTQAPPAPSPEPSGCDHNYTPCVPQVPYDLDCGDIGFRVQVIGGDPHRFDREGDGWGCESYG